MKKLTFITALVLATLLFNGTIEAKTSPGFPKAVQELCQRAESDFSPAAEVIKFPNKDPLFKAIEIGDDPEKIKQLLGNKNPDKIFVMDDITPLMYSATLGNWPAATIFLEAGANINHYSNSLGASVLEMALYRSNFSSACRLIEAGAQLPQSDKDKHSLMRSALAMSEPRSEDGAVFIEYLLSLGYDVNDYGLDYGSPLITAVAMNNVPVIKVLLKHGACIQAAKRGDKTVWTEAQKKNNPKVIELLMEAQKSSNGHACQKGSSQKVRPLKNNHEKSENNNPSPATDAEPTLIMTEKALDEMIGPLDLKSHFGSLAVFGLGTQTKKLKQKRIELTGEQKMLFREYLAHGEEDSARMLLREAAFWSMK